MPTLTFDPTENAPSPDQLQAEAAAMAQGEKLAEAAAADRDAKYAQDSAENENLNLIGGKFKSQEELLKAYEELQKKLSKGEDLDEEEDAPEEPTEAAQEDSGTESILTKAADEYTSGQLSEDTIEELSKMDSKDLIKAYVDFYSKSAAKYQQQVDLQQGEQTEIMKIAGGQERYTEMVQWASENLDQSEIDAFNNVTNSGNYGAIRFAVEALNNRFTSAEGFEAPMLTGKAPANTGVKPYRSQAELARDISNPLYQTDPAFRQDVEQRLSISGDLL